MIVLLSDGFISHSPYAGCLATLRPFAQAMAPHMAALPGSSGSLVSTARATRPTLLSAASQAGASTTATTGVMSMSSVIVSMSLMQPNVLYFSTIIYPFSIWLHFQN